MCIRASNSEMLKVTGLVALYLVYAMYVPGLNKRVPGVR